MNRELSAEARWLEKLDCLPLYEWQDPLALMQSLSPPEGVAGWNFNADAKFKKHQEAWITSRFAAGYAQTFGEPTQIKMVPDERQTPDALMKAGAEEIPLDGYADEVRENRNQRHLFPHLLRHPSVQSPVKSFG